MNQTEQKPLRGARVLLVGCGDVGGVLGRMLLDDGAEVWGLRRRVDLLPAGICPLAADLSSPQSLHALRALAFTQVVVTLTATQRSEQAYRQTYVGGLRHLLAALDQRALSQLLWVSSTSVYHQSDGSWVDEDSPTQPSSPTAQRLLEAETLLRELAQNQAWQPVVIRPSGIYGPGRRHFWDQVRAGHGAAAQPVFYSNRIHRDDLAGFLRHLLLQVASGTALAPCYLASDSEPAVLHEVTRYLAQLQGIDPTTLDESMQRTASRRCRNDRLLASGYQLRYPSYREGYAALV